MQATSRLRTLTALAVTLGVALPGCASLDAHHCPQTDWYAAGFEDGRAGLAGDAVVARVAGCDASAVTPDEERYAAGRAAGLADYCTVAGGIRAGRSGGKYAGVCDADTEDEFLTGYYLGALSADH
jgi:hypothetical protein